MRRFPRIPFVLFAIVVAVLFAASQILWAKRTMGRDWGEAILVGGFLSVVFSPLVFIPLMVVRDLRDQKRGRKECRLCSQCGYDLRAKPHRCPECGKVYVDRSSNDFGDFGPL